jgi:Tol biopolymer transport system component
MNPNDFMTPALAPDGSRVSYTDNGPVARIHVLDLHTGSDITLPGSDRNTNQVGSSFFSPNGLSIGYVRLHAADNTFQFVIASADGSDLGTPIGPRLPQPEGDVNWSWTPDGTAVVVDYGNDGTVRLLPIDGSPGTPLGKGDLSFADIQRLAP